MNQVQQTSLETFEEIQPKLPTRREQVLDVLRRYHDLTNMELASALCWEINRVTPRVYELRRLGKVIYSQVRRCNITKRDVIAWKTRAGNEFMERFEVETT